METELRTVERQFTVYNTNDYNTLIALLKEMDCCCILKISTYEAHMYNNESDVIKITAQGEENHLEFVHYLFKKYKTKVEELNRGLEIRNDV